MVWLPVLISYGETKNAACSFLPYCSLEISITLAGIITGFDEPTLAVINKFEEEAVPLKVNTTESPEVGVNLYLVTLSSPTKPLSVIVNK